MGVSGLWTLLEPVGRRVNIEAIQNKRLAVGETSGRSCMLHAAGAGGARPQGWPSPAA